MTAIPPENIRIESKQRIVYDVLLMMLGALLLWGWSYGRWEMYDVDESRYVRIAAEWLRGKSWLALSFNGEPYDQKPPLTFWIYAAMIKLAGGEISPWAVRLPSVLAGVGIAVLTYLTGLRRFGRSVGLWAGWIMLASPLMFEELPAARLDTFLTGFMTLGLWAWLGVPATEQPGRQRAACFWIGMAGAFFIKGPVGWVIALGTLGIECWLSRSMAPWRALRGWIGLAAVLALVLAWMVGQRATQSGAFVKEQLNEQLIERVFSTELHWEWPYYYLEVMLIDVFTPWTFLLGAALLYLWRTRKAPAADTARWQAWAALRPLVIWVVFPFIFLSIVPGKREQYLFPLLPAMALIAGWYIEARLRQKPVLAWVRYGMAGLSATAALGALWLAVFQAFTPAWGREHEFEPLREERLLMAGIAVAMVVIAWRWRSVRLGTEGTHLLLATMLLIALAWLGCIHPSIVRPIETRDLAMLLNKKLAERHQSRVGVTGRSERAQYIVHGNYHMFELEDEEAWLKENDVEIPPYILATPKDWKEIEGRLGGREYQNIYEFGARGKNVVLWEQVRP